ncbi:hypothetical protein I3760_11G024400 [Carya illinoinensis]|nr:hypothetical protein I3760_11G024400 [Carya illinoinensis]
MGSEKNQETPEVSNTKESSEKTKGPDQEAPDHSQHDCQGEISTSSGLKVHGFENEMISLEKMLKRRQSEDEFKAIGIVGELGVGKSTLCRALLNKNEVKTSFLPRIWVRMSKIKKSEAEKSDAEKIQAEKEAVVKRMLECLGVDDKIIKSISGDDGRALDDKERLNALLYALYLQLNGKKYLIVLDDVWNKDEWYGDLSAEIIRSYDWNKRLAYGLPKGKGGTVIVTSRNKEVAKMMVGKEENIHDLLPLWNQESCWSIFTDTVEREKQVLNFNLKEEVDLKKAKKDLFEKCGGLPLAAKMLGKTMAEKLKDEAARKPQVPVPERRETHDDEASGEGTDHVGDIPRSETHDDGASGKPQLKDEAANDDEASGRSETHDEARPQVPVSERRETHDNEASGEGPDHVGDLLRSETHDDDGASGKPQRKDEAAKKPQVPVSERSETHDDEASGEGTDNIGDLPRSEIHDDGASGKPQLKDVAAKKPQVPVSERSETHDDEASGEGTDHVGGLPRSEIHDDGASGKSQDVGRVAQDGATRSGIDEEPKPFDGVPRENSSFMYGFK